MSTLASQLAAAPSSYDREWERRCREEEADERFLEHALEVLQGERAILSGILSEMPSPEKLFKRLWEWHMDIGVEIEKLENEWKDKGVSH